MIRFAMESDGEAVYRLLCMLEERELERTAFERIYAACLKSPDRVCLVAEQEGEVVAACRCAWRSSSTTAQRWRRFLNWPYRRTAAPGAWGGPS